MVVTNLTPLTKPANFKKQSQSPNKMKGVVSNLEKWNPNAMTYEAKAGLSFNSGNPHQSYFLSSQSIQDLATTIGNSILCVKYADQLAIPSQDKTNQNSYKGKGKAKEALVKGKMVQRLGGFRITFDERCTGKDKDKKLDVGGNQKRQGKK